MPTSFAEKIKAFFSAIGDFLMPFIHQFLSDAGQALLSSAMKAVVQVAADPAILSNEEKRKAAFDVIVQDLTTQGITIGTSAINGAIEAAVAKMKAGE